MSEWPDNSAADCGGVCARCILKFSEGEVPWSEQLYRSLGSFYNGLGIGSICCGLLGAAMVIGLHCPTEEAAMQKTLLLFQQIQEKYGSLYCPRIKTPEDECQALLDDIAGMTKEILSAP